MGGLNMLRDHPDIPEDRHEIGVSVPARDDVKVHMLFHTGPGHTAEEKALGLIALGLVRVTIVAVTRILTHPRG